MAVCEVEVGHSVSLAVSSLQNVVANFVGQDLLSRNLTPFRLIVELRCIHSDCAAQSVGSMAVCQVEFQTLSLLAASSLQNVVARLRFTAFSHRTYLLSG